MKSMKREPPPKDQHVSPALFSPPLRPQNNKGGAMRYRALLEAAPDAVIVVNQSSAIVLVNAQAEKLFGYRRSELMGQPAEILISERSRIQHNDQFSRFLTSNSERPTVAGLELFGLRKDGSEFPVEIRLSPLDTNQGILVSSAIRDISERRRTEEDLRRLAAIVTCSDDAIIGKTLEGIITDWNAGAERIYGYSAKEAIGKSVRMLASPDRPNEVSDILARLKRGEVIDHFETLRVRRDGKVFHMEITESPIKDATDKIVGASSIGRDISVRKAAENNLIQMEARYRGLLEAAPDAMVIVNQAGEIVLLNLQAERQFGYLRDELLGQKVTTIIPEGFAERLLTHGTGSAGDPIVPQMGTGIELYGRRKNGSDFPIEIMQSPLDGADGILVTAAIRDITERKKREDDLSRLAAVVESSDDAIIGQTVDGIITNWNGSAQRIYGYSAAEIVGRSNVILFPPDHIAENVEMMEKIKRGERVERSDALRLRKDGMTVHLGLVDAPIKNAESQVLGISTVARDLTQSRNLEEMLRQSQKMEAVGQLAGGVAHDFNNLLGVILGYTEFLLERLGPDDAWHNDVEQIQKAGIRAALLTRQLLAYSRKQVLQPKVLDLNSVVAATEDLLRRLIGENIELLVLLNPALGLVKADSGQLEQIIMNLAVNARDAMPSGGKLIIETSNVEIDEKYSSQHDSPMPGPHVMLAMTDNGCGMDEKTKSHIFEPFFTTKEFGKGTGLGLSTVYGIVKQSGGFVWVYTEPGIGTTFKIYFPSVQPIHEIESPTFKINNIVKGSETILIVEDEAALLQVTRRSLEEAGYAILAARNPIEAIQIAESHPGPIHLMVTDVILPGINGAQLASQLSSLRPEMKVLFISGYTDHAIIRHGVLEPGLAFLQKPISPKTLIRKVGELLATTLSFAGTSPFKK